MKQNIGVKMLKVIFWCVKIKLAVSEYLIDLVFAKNSWVLKLEARPPIFKC